MKTIELNEDQLTEIIKAALEHYRSKAFGNALIVEVPGGLMVQFADAGDRKKSHVEQSESESRSDTLDISNPASPLSPLNPINLIDLSGGGFGGFGGGSSGGAGASGDW